MAKYPIAATPNSDFLEGDKLFLQRARETLPYLVRQAKAGQTIYYSDLAQELGIPNARNLGTILGAIGNALIDLGKKLNIEIPPIQCLVVNKQSGLPGAGVGWFLDAGDFGKLSNNIKKKVVDTHLAKIYTFRHWDLVLSELDLKPGKVKLKTEIREARTRGNGGESIHHSELKKYIAQNPCSVGLSARAGKGVLEYSFPSADAIDVLFTDRDAKIGIEVKSAISDTADLLRGLFQCVKYKHLIAAEQIINDQIPNSRVILALEGHLPKELILIKNLLAIEVVEGVQRGK